MLLNNTLQINVPEGFQTMDPEAASAKLIEKGEGVCLSNPDRHILMTIGWKTLGRFTGFLLKEKDLEKNMESSILNAMKPFQCHNDGPCTQNIGGQEARGFCYHYIAQDTEMSAASILLRREKTVYYFHLYTRTALVQENTALWEELLTTARWIA